MTVGYSGAPLPKKLGLKSGHLLVLLDAPAEWTIANLDPAVEVRRDLRRSPDVVVGFVRSAADLRRLTRRTVKAIPSDGSLWLVWPRRAGGHVSDVTEQLLRDLLLPTGMVDTKVAAIDKNWSGLKFVWRKEFRRP
ncbi:MAG TPA: DUF3052 domain-containing protein [Acidimicrobiia bacterium]|nr:DUF3052 domain-containing protein [Acidimicrobiia bacterium]